VKTWKNAFPKFDELGEAFGSGVYEAIIDVEKLFGRNSGKKKKGIRTTIPFHEETWNRKKREHDWETAFRRKRY
jgi:hypothetical protein